ncbi:MAG: hypothetical protein RLQ12_21210, partial [Cyclobacteriaceae bacterium]
SEELYNIVEDPYEWKNLAGLTGYAPVLNLLRTHIPEKITPPMPGNTVRLMEMKDGVPYWEGEAIQSMDPIPMKFK